GLDLAAALEILNGLEGEVADGAAGEAGQVGHRRRLEAGQVALERVHRVAGEVGLHIALAEGGDAVADDELLADIEAEDGVATPFLAAFDGLQEEELASAL